MDQDDSRTTAIYYSLSLACALSPSVLAVSRLLQVCCVFVCKLFSLALGLSVRSLVIVARVGFL